MFDEPQIKDDVENSAASLLDAMFGEDEEVDHVETSVQPPIAIVKCTQSRGMSCVSTRNIRSGELILMESPVYLWDGLDWTEKDFFCELISRLCADNSSLEAMSFLYPRSLDDISPEEFETMRMHLSDQILNELSTGTKMDTSYIVHVALILKHNGFSSGLYRWLTMINHSCEPNCIKLRPALGNSLYSEVWAIREILQGEEITINYCEFMEMSFAERQSFLHANHGFRCDCTRCSREAYWTTSENEYYSEMTNVLKEAFDLLESSSSLSTEQTFDRIQSVKQTYLNYSSIPSKFPYLQILRHKTSIESSKRLLEMASDRKRDERYHSLSLGDCLHAARNLIVSSTGILHLLSSVGYAIHPEYVDYHSNIVSGIKYLLKNAKGDISKWFENVDECSHIDFSSSKTVSTAIAHHQNEVNHVAKNFATKQRYPQVLNLRPSSGKVFWNK
jgi:hypothetical protein